jgi:hypothetical protein
MQLGASAADHGGQIAALHQQASAADETNATAHNGGEEHPCRQEPNVREGAPGPGRLLLGNARPLGLQVTAD